MSSDRTARSRAPSGRDSIRDSEPRSAPTFDRRTALGVFLAFVVALLVTLPNLAGDPSRLYPLQGDSVKYHALGKGLAQLVRELPSALGSLFAGGWSAEQRARFGLEDWIFQHTPLYGSTLGAVYLVSGDAEAAGRGLSAFFLAGSAALCFLFLRRRVPELWSAAGTLLLILWPSHLYYGTAIMTEVPILFFLFLAATALDHTRGARSAKALVLGGLGLGALLLSKTTFRFVVPLVLAIDLLPLLLSGERRPREWIRHLGLRTVGVLVALAPVWLFLTLARMPHDPLSESGEAALWLYRGNYVPDRGFENVGVGDAWTEELFDASSRLRASGRSGKRALYEEAFRIVRSRDREGWIALTLGKVAWFWRYPAIKTDLDMWFASLPPPIRLQPLLAMLALAGLSTLAFRRGEGAVLGCLAAYISLVHGASHLVSRYNIPALGAALPFAVLAAHALFRVLRERLGATDLRLWVVPMTPPLVLGALALVFDRDLLRGSLSLGPIPAYAAQTVLRSAAVLAWAIPLGRAYRTTHGLLATGAALALFPGGVALFVFALGWNAPDKDRFSARLERPGDEIVQEIPLPIDFRVAEVAEAEIVCDLLSSVESGFELSIRVNGREAARMQPNLESNAEAFLLDREVYAAQERYARVERTVRKNLEEFVRHRHPDAGYEYYRQWYRVRFPKEWLGERETARIELVLERASPGTWVECYGDEIVAFETDGRRVNAPALLDNAFELSNYRFELFASDRIEADARLIRPLRFRSRGTIAEFRRGGMALADLSPARGTQTGEYRIRLRIRPEGGWVFRSEGGESHPVWARTPSSRDRPLTPREVHALAVDRDRYFNGYQMY